MQGESRVEREPQVKRERLVERELSALLEEQQVE